MQASTKDTVLDVAWFIGCITGLTCAVLLVISFVLSWTSETTVDDYQGEGDCVFVKHIEHKLWFQEDMSIKLYCSASPGPAWQEPYGGCKEAWRYPKSEGYRECQEHGLVP